MTNTGEGKDLSYFRKCNQSKLAVAHIYINSLRSKLELLTEKTKGNVDIWFIFEIKNDKSFANS